MRSHNMSRSALLTYIPVPQPVFGRSDRGEEPDTRLQHEARRRRGRLRCEPYWCSHLPVGLTRVLHHGPQRADPVWLQGCDVVR
jgi:hypothetical protein